MNTPTPRTDAESFLSRGMGIVPTLPKEAVRIDFARTLERELTAVTEQRDRLLEQQEQWRLSSAFKEIDMMGIRYAAAEMHHANNMQEVTKQRDRLAEVLRKFVGDALFCTHADTATTVLPHQQVDDDVDALTMP